MHRTAAAVVLTAALVLPAAGCGNGGPEAPAESFGTVGGQVDLARYTTAFCGALEDLGDIVVAVFNADDGANEAADRPGSSSEAVAAEYRDTLKTMSEAAGRARTRLTKVGYPNVPQGEEIAGKIRELMAFGSLVADLKGKIERLDGSPRELLYGASQELAEFAKTLVSRLKSLRAFRDRQHFAASHPGSCG